MLQLKRQGRVSCCLFMLGLLACGGSASQPQTANAQASAPKPGTPAQNLVNAYVVLQGKLAKSDAAGAKGAFAAVQSAVKASGLSIDPALQKRIEGAAAHGASATNLANARTAFAALSDGFLALFKSAENPLTEPLTVAFCPMALDSKGAKWLQLGERIQNPYFGTDMLTCGSVEGSVKPGKKL